MASLVPDTKLVYINNGNNDTSARSGSVGIACVLRNMPSQIMYRLIRLYNGYVHFILFAHTMYYVPHIRHQIHYDVKSTDSTHE